MGFGVWQFGGGVAWDRRRWCGGRELGLVWRGEEEQIRGALLVAKGFGDWEAEGEVEVLELAMRAFHRGGRF